MPLNLYMKRGRCVPEYFWIQQDNIPSGMGYPLFGKTHLTSVAIVLISVILLSCIFLRLQEKVQQRFLKAIPLIMIGLEIFKDCVLLSQDKFGLGYLPLHVCSLGIYVFFLREFLPWKRAKEILGEISFVLIMPSATAGLIFADWTKLYPVLNFFNLQSYVWHGLLVLYPLLLLLRKDINPSVRHIYWVIGFLCIVVPFIYAFDKHFGCNYFFINCPVPGSPLEWFAGFLGNPGYLIGYAGIALIIMLIVYGCLWIIKLLKK